MDAKCLLAKNHIDESAGCRYRLIHSESEYFPPHYHDYYELFLTIQGGIIHHVNGFTQKLNEGSLVFIRPNDQHYYEYDGKHEFVFANLTFTAETVDELFHYLSDGFPSQKLLSVNRPPTVLLDGHEKDRLSQKMAELNAINWQDKPRLKMIMRSLLMNIFIQYFSDISFEEKYIPSWLELTYERMKKPKNFIAGPERMLELCGKSREHLSRSMKKYYGMSVTNYINDLRLNYLASLLINSDAPILDLCYESGFQNISWCYTLFKEKYGVSPKDFRKSAVSNSEKQH